MKVTKEVNSVYDFDFRGGAKDTVKELTYAEIEQVISMLEELYPDGMTDTEFNDIFWFEDDMIAQWLWYEDFEHIVESNKRGCDVDCANCMKYDCPYCKNEPEEDEEKEEED